MHKKLLLLLLLPITGFANCDQETIQFYIDKGFSQEQITKLCTSSSNQTPSYQPYQKPVVIVQEGYATGIDADERKAVNALRGGIEARSVDVTPSEINYIRKVCVKWKESPNVEHWLDKCIDVAFSVSRSNLAVNHSSEGLLVLFGQKHLEISSENISRKYVVSDPWAQFSPDKRFALKRKYETLESGNSTVLPLRNTADSGQMVNSIRALADATKAKKHGVTTSEVARVLDDSYVPPTEEEYLKSQPSYEDIQEEKKKSKKWWNPFD